MSHRDTAFCHRYGNAIFDGAHVERGSNRCNSTLARQYDEGSRRVFVHIEVRFAGFNEDF